MFDQRPHDGNIGRFCYFQARRGPREAPYDGHEYDTPVYGAGDKGGISRRLWRTA